MAPFAPPGGFLPSSGLGYPVGLGHLPQVCRPLQTILLGLSGPPEPHKRVCLFDRAVMAGPAVVGNPVRGSSLWNMGQSIPISRGMGRWGTIPAHAVNIPRGVRTTTWQLYYVRVSPGTQATSMGSPRRPPARSERRRVTILPVSRRA